AAADIFTALMEDRPYRKGMSGGSAMKILRTMCAAGKCDCGIIDLLEKNIDAVNAVRVKSQAEAAEKYQTFRQESK
ncbi:MAG: metal-dependent phosphohydrolase, partial [Spirochaetota bacterium]